jgi:hypothetical protein
MGQQEEHMGGLTINGFKQWWLYMISRFDLNKKDDTIWKWIENLGYDYELHPIRSRWFNLSIHSTRPVELKVRDAIQTDIDARASILILEKYGQVMQQTEQFVVRYTFSEQVLAYSYCAKNNLRNPIDFTMDCSKSEKILFSNRESIITKRILPGQKEFLMHSRAAPNCTQF